eukprot:89610-Rhodomonas_salina.1
MGAYSVAFGVCAITILALGVDMPGSSLRLRARGSAGAGAGTASVSVSVSQRDIAADEQLEATRTHDDHLSRP